VAELVGEFLLVIQYVGAVKRDLLFFSEIKELSTWVVPYFGTLGRDARFTDFSVNSPISVDEN
jgi:hypothetical protein